MQDEKINILCNEAERQRALDALVLSFAINGDKDNQIGKALKSHGVYTEGFYDEEFNKLKAKFSK